MLDHTTLALALANRSAALVHLKEYETAVRDIQLSLQSGYPDDQKHKLYDRLGYCYQQLADPVRARTAYTVALDCLERRIKSAEENSVSGLEKMKLSIQNSLSKLSGCGKSAKEPQPNGSEELPSLMGGCHPDMPNASSALTLASEDGAGRYFKAHQDIKPGQTLVSEAPYAACLLPDKFSSNCHNCFVR